MVMNALTLTATKNLRDIVEKAIVFDRSRHALVVYDVRSPLARIITDAYRAALPDADTLDVDSTTPDAVLARMNAMSPGDLIVLVQSSSFRLNEFRLRIELFKLGLAVIEHVHLERNDESQFAAYIDALAYDREYYQRRGHELKQKIDRAQTIVVQCAGTTLTYEGGMEETKLNIGDYRGMKNIGGTFPIGEVFSEPKDFTRVNGEVMIFAFADTGHIVRLYTPFRMRIAQGVVISHDGPPSFAAILQQIGDEEQVLVREFGIGLNPAMGKHRVVNDITAFERQKGLHFSLGEKHGVYKKPGLPQKKTRYHIDVFVDAERIEIDGEDVLKTL